MADHETLNSENSIPFFPDHVKTEFKVVVGMLLALLGEVPFTGGIRISPVDEGRALRIGGGPVAFVGERHFDDPFALETMFVKPE